MIECSYAVTKTAKFTEIRHNIYENCDIYEICEIYLNLPHHQRNLQNLFTGSHEIYSEGYKQGPSKVTKITNFWKFTKTAKFTIIRQPIQKICSVYPKGYKEVPNKICENYEFYEIYENC